MDKVYVQDKVVKSEEVAKAEAVASVANTAISEVAAVIKEMEKVAISSPLVAVTLTIITADWLHTHHQLSDNAYNLVVWTALGAAGITAAGTLIADIAELKGLTIGNSPAGLLTNSVTTLVTSDNQTAGLQALLAKKPA